MKSKEFYYIRTMRRSIIMLLLLPLVCSVALAQKTEIIFLNDVNSFKKVNQIKIENFRILGYLLNKYVIKI